MIRTSLALFGFRDICFVNFSTDLGDVNTTVEETIALGVVEIGTKPPILIWCDLGLHFTSKEPGPQTN